MAGIKPLPKGGEQTRISEGISNRKVNAFLACGGLLLGPRWPLLSAERRTLAGRWEYIKELIWVSACGDSSFFPAGPFYAPMPNKSSPAEYNKKNKTIYENGLSGPHPLSRRVFFMRRSLPKAGHWIKSNLLQWVSFMRRYRTNPDQRE